MFPCWSRRGSTPLLNVADPIRPPVRSSSSDTAPARVARGGAAPDGGDQAAVILVVERDPHVRELEAYFLHEAGFHVAFAADGVAALETVRRERPAVVVTEILVPRLDGLALCRAIKADAATSGTAVLVFSILAANARAREAGADAFLMKPLAERRLVDSVRELMAARQLHRTASGAAGRRPPATPEPA
jgi:two-component system response regulator MprA